MKIELKNRDIKGKKVKNMRIEGLVPANVYGPKASGMNMYVDTKGFIKVFEKAGYNNLIDVSLEGESKTQKMLIKEVQVDPIKGLFLHVSFYAVDMDKIITTEIPVHVEGESPAVKKNIGILVTPLDILTVRCLPSDLPSNITININNLINIGDSIKVSDVTLPANVEFTHDVLTETTLVYIAPPQKKVIEEEKPKDEVLTDEKKDGEESDTKEESKK